MAYTVVSSADIVTDPIGEGSGWGRPEHVRYESEAGPHLPEQSMTPIGDSCRLRRKRGRIEPFSE
jgi:hypothetical protein